MLVTALDVGGARVTVTDFMPVVGAVPSRGAPDTAAQLLRVVRCEGGDAAVDVEWAPRPDYACAPRLGPNRYRRGRRPCGSRVQ
jgi:hypothetical protein